MRNGIAAAQLARSLALQGAEVLLFHTAIGTEPLDPAVDAMPHWQRTMPGHAAANMGPWVGSNRVGHKAIGNSAIAFYVASFIADATGAKVAKANRTDECVLTASFDLDAVQDFRRSWGTFRDRRPALFFGALQTMDGAQVVAG